MWMFIPTFGKLSRFMSNYKQSLKSAGYDEEHLGAINAVYYHNYDLHLLLNLLANSNGVAPAIATIAQFDKVLTSVYSIHMIILYFPVILHISQA